MMNWDTILFVAFSAIGVLQYLKGLFAKAPSWIWAITLPVACIGLSCAWAVLPLWVAQGILALALSQLGYETIIQTVKKLIGAKQ